MKGLKTSFVLPNKDEDTDDDPLGAEPEPEDDAYGKHKYLSECHRLGIVPVSQILKYLETEEMHVVNYGLGVKGVMALCEALKVNTTVKALRLRDNMIPEDGVRLLAETLQGRVHITVVDVSGNKGNLIGCKALMAACNQMGAMITTLGLAHMGLGNKEALVVAAALETNKTVRSLDLSHNSLEERAALAFGKMLALNVTLRELNVSWNKLRSKGSLHLLEGLVNNSSVASLGMAWVGMGDAGAEALGGLLKENSSLADVDVCGNSISAAGALALAEGIAVSESLAAVFLDSNDLKDDGGRAIVGAVHKNKGMVRCRMDNTNVSDGVRGELEALLEPRLEALQQLIA